MTLESRTFRSYLKLDLAKERVYANNCLGNTNFKLFPSFLPQSGECLGHHDPKKLQPILAPHHYPFLLPPYGPEFSQTYIWPSLCSRISSNFPSSSLCWTSKQSSYWTSCDSNIKSNTTCQFLNNSTSSPHKFPQWISELVEKNI